MIKDAYTHKTLSEYGKDRVFVVNAGMSEVLPDDENALAFVSKIKGKKWFYLLKEELLEEESYPYQALLLKEAEQMGNGFLVDAMDGNDVLLTAVRNKIPVATHASHADVWHGQILRLAAINEMNIENLDTKQITSENYDRKTFASIFLTPEEARQKRSLPIDSEVLVLAASIIGFAVYSYAAMTSFMEKKSLEAGIAKFQTQKQAIEKQLSNAFPAINLIEYYKQKERTDKTVTLLRNVSSNSPISRALESTDTTLLIDNYSPTVRTALAKYSPSIGVKGVTLTIK